ncbi:MAG: hypothetical protein M1836_003992 [Candelina mexicana]|nr:MAG: hypothetical protein M1836_003992 [Candelina mexicana]
MASGHPQHDTYIKRWLSQTAEDHAYPVVAPALLPASGTEYPVVHDDSKKAGSRRRKKLSEPDCGKGDGLNNQTPGHGQLGIPGRLGLQAAFRIREENEAAAGGRRLSTTGHKQKRKRESSSDSSFLEADTRRTLHMPTTVDHHRPRAIQADKRRVSQEGALSYASASTASTEKLDRRYHRRPRHKTRADRYDPTLPEGRKPKPKKLKVTKHIKKQRSRKEPAPLLHDFSAQNVSGERLTLKPSLSIGLFKNGRASSPVRGRGLPDLTFSEMKFLEKRKAKPEEDKTSKRTGRKLGRAPAGQEEISSYFASAQKVMAERNPSLAERLAGHTSEGGGAPNAFRDSDSRGLTDSTVLSGDRSTVLPPEGFLGGGTRGARYDTPPIRSATLSENGLCKSAIQSVSRQSRNSTAYFTWSRSGPPPETPNITSCRSSAKLSKLKNTGDLVSPLGTIEKKQFANRGDVNERQETFTDAGPPDIRAQDGGASDAANQDKRATGVDPSQDGPIRPGRSRDVQRSIESHNMDPLTSTEPTIGQTSGDNHGQCQCILKPQADLSASQRQGQPLPSVTDLMKECESGLLESHIIPPSLRPLSVSYNTQKTAPKSTLDISECSSADRNGNPYQPMNPSRRDPPLTDNANGKSIVAKSPQFPNGMSSRNFRYEYGSRGLFGFCTGLSDISMPSNHFPQLQTHTSETSSMQPSSLHERNSSYCGRNQDRPKVPAWDEAWPQAELHMHGIGQQEPPLDSYDSRDTRISDGKLADDSWKVNRKEQEYLDPMVEGYEKPVPHDGACPGLDSTLSYGYPPRPLNGYSEHIHSNSRCHYLENDGWYGREGYQYLMDDDYLEDNFISAKNRLNKSPHAFGYKGVQEVEHQFQPTNSPSTPFPSFWRPHKLY